MDGWQLDCKLTGLVGVDSDVEDLYQLDYAHYKRCFGTSLLERE